ncbi:MAG: hypothetical protein Q9225_007552 [Loekoesia sp. 1 TL-2023]
MDYFIDDMLGSTRRGSAKSLPTSPAPSEPPLPPTPTPTRTKKAKSVKFPGEKDLAEAGRSNAEVSTTEQQQVVAYSKEEEGEATAAKEMPADRVESPPPPLHVLQTPVPVIQNQPAIMIGLSGSPASGKTTLAHLLSLVLPPTTSSFIIHQDDFFIRKHLLIPDADGRVNVDYRRTVDFTAFKMLISYSKRKGRLPPGFRSLQPKEQQEDALSPVSPEIIERLRASLAGLPSLHDGRSVGIVDGFLLYHSETIRNLIDIKMLLRASKEASKSRRFERLHHDGLGSDQESHPWDTTEYFDRVIWRNYADEHAVLFEDRDVEGRPELTICEGVDILVQPNLDMGVEEVLQWVVEVFRKGCEEAAYGHERDIVSAVDWENEYEACNCNEGFLGRIRQAIFDHI